MSRPRAASMRSGPGRRMRTGPTGTPSTSFRNRPARRAIMSDSYDVIIIGAGSPGEHCAGAFADGGLRVALVEREVVGGECSYWACIPSKTLLRPGEAVHGANEAAAKAQVMSRRHLPGATTWYRATPTQATSDGSSTTASTCGRGRLAGTGVVEVDGV